MLNDFLEEYKDSGIARFHMPGHKGNYPPLANLLPYDITEIKGADTLYAPHGVLREAEEAAAEFYGSRATIFSAGGSTLCIHTMLAVLRRYGVHRRVLAGRGAHSSFVHACALTGITPQWMLPETRTGSVCGVITPKQVEAALSKDSDFDAVYLTSPNYYGGVCDIAAIAKICHKYAIPLLVDNAHGAHFKITPNALHPIDAGADLCCDSLHKTLPVLTGGAMLHSRLSLTLDELTDCMALTGSTSPSYLILSSLEEGLRYQKEEGKSEFAHLVKRVQKLREVAASVEITSLTGKFPCDPARLTLDARKIGYTGTALAEYLRDCRIEPEYADAAGVVLLPSPQNKEGDFAKLQSALLLLPPKESVKESAWALTLPEQVLTPREALFSESVKVPTAEAAGKIAARTVQLCPPCIPLVSPGERVTPSLCETAKNAGIDMIDVVV